jgi:flavin-dependent dehydrogenase
VGGGPAGSIAARHLAQKGRKVLLIERQSGPSERIGETLPPAGESLIRQMKLFEAFEAQRHTRSTTIRSSWRSDNLQETDYSFHPLGFWWHLDRRDFDTMLLKETERSGVDVRRAANIVELSRINSQGVWQMRIQSASQCGTVEARFLIDATGRASFVARRLGVQRRRIDRLVAVVGVVEVRHGTTGDTIDSALIEPAEYGWWYIGPTMGSWRVATLFTDADLLKGKSILNSWFSQYQSTIHERKELSPCEPQRTLKVYVADSSLLATCSGEGWLAVGDAAAGRDPLSSSGLLYALESGSFSSIAADEFLDGNRQSVVDYDHKVKQNFAEYVADRNRYYSLVSRWPDSCFWQRRLHQS